jgi:hypothetical protein
VIIIGEREWLDWSSRCWPGGCSLPSSAGRNTSQVVPSWSDPDGVSLRRSGVVLTRHEHRVIDVHVAAPEGALVATPGGTDELHGIPVASGSSVELSRGAVRCAGGWSDRAGDHDGHRQEHRDGENGAEHGEVVADEADQRWSG